MNGVDDYVLMNETIKGLKNWQERVCEVNGVDDYVLMNETIKGLKNWQERVC